MFYYTRLEKVGQNPTDYPLVTRDVGRLFLGVDLKCCQCHNHKYIKDYKQVDFQGLMAMCFFGDGAAAEGTFHESLNLASIWELPVIYLCENNAYGEWMAFADICSVGDIAARAAGYSMPGTVVDGQDVIAVFDTVSDAVARARSGGGPSLVETKTYRYWDHSGGATIGAPYRTQAEVDEWLRRDPIALLHDRVIEGGVTTEHELEDLEREEQQGIDRAWQFALDSPFPDPNSVFEHLFSNPIPVQ